MPGLVHPLLAMAALASVAIGPDAVSTAPAGAVASAPVSHAIPAASLPQPLRDAASGPMSPAAPDLLDDPGALADGLADETWRQVRIEQRLIIRITPGIMGRDMPPPPPMPQPMMVLRGRHGGGCVALGGIAAIAPSSSDSQIVLLLRDRRQVVASLEKTCNARDFYVGFYAERSSDGMLCTGRDVIHSRAGASCMITRLRDVGR